jgi:broad specificity phosphatase PhoE
MGFFYFLRHGETEWNAEGRLCGSTDVPLSDVGRAQAQLLAQRLQSIEFDALYSSPLQRALETARLIGAVIKREPMVDRRLSELDYGAWEGSTFDEIRRITPAVYRAWDADPANLAPPGGETGVHLIERVMPFLSDVAQRHPTGNVVVVCHKTVCRLLACHIMDVPLSEYRRRIPMENAALNIFELEAGRWHIVTLNEVAHLSARLDAPLPGVPGE